MTGFVAVVAPGWALPIGTLQFCIAPLSFPVCIIRIWAYLPGAIVHYTLCVLLGPALGGTGFALTIGPELFFAWMATDQICNIIVYWRTSMDFGAKRLMRHILCGTANAKIYYVVVFGCLQGLQIDLVMFVLVSVLALLVDSYFMKDIFAALGVPCHEVRYYVDHRICHLPGVYLHAHKMHHHLHDTAPWDGFLYGSGLNEQFFWWFLDILPCLSGLSPWMLPYCFNGYLFEISWRNKLEHTRTTSDLGFKCYGHENYHADHHTLHVKNISLEAAALLDFYFGTQGSQTKAANGCVYTREEKQTKGDSRSEIIITVKSTNK